MLTLAQEKKIIIKKKEKKKNGGGLITKVNSKRNMAYINFKLITNLSPIVNIMISQLIYT